MCFLLAWRQDGFPGNVNNTMYAIIAPMGLTHFDLGDDINNEQFITAGITQIVLCESQRTETDMQQ